MVRVEKVINSPNTPSYLKRGKLCKSQPCLEPRQGLRKKETVMSLIIAENIQKDYKTGEVTVKALKGLSFEIAPASFVSFVGPSGSGKTTLLNLIGCLDKPTGGKLRVADNDVLHFDRKQSALFRGSNIGFIFQDFNLIPVLTVMKILNTHYLWFRMSLPQKEKRG